MIARLATFFGSLRGVNVALNDEIAALKFENTVLRLAVKELRKDAAYGRRQRDNRARYDAKRRP